MDALVEVDRLLDAGVAFERIEAYIEERGDLDVGTRNALWLMAWAETDPESRRRAVRELVQDAGAGVASGWPRR